jgi:hypothetical protein
VFRIGALLPVIITSGGAARGEAFSLFRASKTSARPSYCGVLNSKINSEKDKFYKFYWLRTYLNTKVFHMFFTLIFVVLGL